MSGRGPSVFSPGPSELRSDNEDNEDSPPKQTTNVTSGRGPSVFSPGPSELRSDNEVSGNPPPKRAATRPRPRGGRAPRNSDRSNAITRSQARSLRGVQEKSSTFDNTFNQCFWCHQGGDIAVCSNCSSQAFCCSRGSQPRCLPEWAFTAKDFRCPECHKALGTTINYRLPSFAPSRGGRDTSPLIFYGIFNDDSVLARSAINLLEGQVTGYFTGKESELLALTVPFSHRKRLTAELRANITRIRNFMSSKSARLVMVIQTHADPDTGELHRGVDEFGRLGDLLADILGDIPLHQFSKSVLFVNSCGGFVKHYVHDLKAAATSLGFSTSLGFTSGALDPLLTARTVLYNIIDHHVVGSAAIRAALSHAASFELLRHTSVLACSFQESTLLCGATIRYRPNGIGIRCPQCGQTSTHYKTAKDHSHVIFRCPIPHPVRKFRVDIITNNENTLVCGQPGNSSRHMIRTHEYVEHLISLIDL